MTRRDEPAKTERDAVLAEHAELREITNEVGGAKSRDALLGHLEGLHERAVKHFAREESEGGFFETVLERAPRHQAALEALQKEHTAILAAAERLIGRLRIHSPKAPLDDLVADARELATRLQQHEATENELLLEVMDTDLGTGD